MHKNRPHEQGQKNFFSEKSALKQSEANVMKVALVLIYFNREVIIFSYFYC